MFPPTLTQHELTSIYFRAAMLIWTLRPMITSGKSGFSPDGFIGGTDRPFTILNSCLVYIQFNDRLASVTGKGCYKSQWSLAQVSDTATEGRGMKGWIWLLLMLFVSTLSHKVWQVHNGYFCSWQAWLLTPHHTGLGLPPYFQSLRLHFSWVYTSLSIPTPFRDDRPYWIYFRSGLPILEKGVLTGKCKLNKRLSGHLGKKKNSVS